jgi:hypothetical protein
MSLNDETCDFCGGYIDSMNSDAISRRVNGVDRLWCDIEHVKQWVQEQQQHQKK